MWILPKNHPLSSVFVPESEVLNEDLKGLSEEYERSALWRSKPSSAKTWLARWKRVYWIPRLFGRTLKPFQQKSFEEKLRASLVDTHALPSPLLASGKGKMTNDTFGRLYETMSSQLDLFGASSKMLTTTSPWDSTLFTRTYEHWVTSLRSEFTLRKRLARHMKGNASSSSLFTTPVSTDSNRNTQYQQGGTALSVQAKWPTARVSDVEGGRIQTEFKDGSFRSMRKTSNQEFGAKLRDAVEMTWPTATVTGNHNRKGVSARAGDGLSTAVKKGFPTPSSRDHKGATTNPREGHSPMLDQFVAQWPTPTFGGHNQGSMQEWGGSKNWMRGGQPDQEPSTTGSIQELSRGRLNPKWVCQLMGTTFEKIFFVR